MVNSHLKKVIDAAVLLNVSMVGTFVGRNIDKNERENFDELENVFGELVNYAEQQGIKLMIENCPMIGKQFPGIPGNLAYSPELWEEMFRRVPNKNFGLNFCIY